MGTRPMSWVEVEKAQGTVLEARSLKGDPAGQMVLQDGDKLTWVRVEDGTGSARSKWGAREYHLINPPA